MSPSVPSPPPPPAPPPVPTIDDARQRQMGEDAFAKRRGRASQILTGPQGDTSAAPVGVKTLLGQ